MSRAGVEEPSFVVDAVVTTHGDDDAQPDIAEHANRLGVLLPAGPYARVIDLRPRAAPQATEGELPQRGAQGMNAGAPNPDDAGGPAGPGHGRGAGLALGDGSLAIPVAIVAQFPDHPGGETVTSARQAAVELAVRMELQYPLNLPIVGVQLRGEGARLLGERAGQAGLGAHDDRGNLKAPRLHGGVNPVGFRGIPRGV